MVDCFNGGSGNRSDRNPGMAVYEAGSQGTGNYHAESKKNSYTSDMTTEDLLEGVKAVDKRDGDVSASLTVENVYPNEKGDEVTVVYVAKDNSNNVTKVTYHMTSEGNLMGFTSETKTSSDNTDTDAETDEACRMKMRLIQKMKKNQK